MVQSYYSRSEIRDILQLVRDRKMGVNEASTRMTSNAQKPLKKD